MKTVPLQPKKHQMGKLPTTPSQLSSAPTAKQEQRMIENYRHVVKNMQDKIDELKVLEKERMFWNTERANTYMELGELERILFSNDTPAKKVSACKKVIKNLNDPEFLQRLVG